MKEKIITVTYGKEDTWTNRKKAMEFFMDCMRHSEGCERERYTNVYFKLMDGLTYCTDDDD